MAWVTDGPGVPVPNPFAPFFTAPQPGQRVGRRWLAQMHMRSKILAAARSSMAELGFEGVHLRPIAQQCGISVQTIYNLVGDRGSVLRASSEDWVMLLADFVRTTTERNPEASLIFAMIETFWSTPLRWPSYVTRAVETSAEKREPLNEPFVKSSVRVLRSEILALKERGRLRASVDVTSLARQLTSVTHALICAWAFDRYDLDQYRRDLVNGPGMMLLGAVRGDELRRIEDAIDKLAT